MVRLVVKRDRREAGEARPLLLVAAGGEPFDEVVVREHGAPDCGAASAYGTQAGEHFGRTKGQGRRRVRQVDKNGPVPTFRFPGSGRERP